MHSFEYGLSPKAYVYILMVYYYHKLHQPIMSYVKYSKAMYCITVKLSTAITIFINKIF